MRRTCGQDSVAPAVADHYKSLDFLTSASHDVVQLSIILLLQWEMVALRARMKKTAYSILRGLVLINLGLNTVVVFADQKTIRFTPPPWQAGGCSTFVNPGCGYASNLDPSQVVGGLLHDELACLRFTDPTPPLSKVTSIDLRMGYEPRTTTPAVMEVHLYLGSGHGHFPENFVGSFSPGNVRVERRCAPPYNTLPLGNIDGVEHEDGIRGYVYGGTNGLVFTDTLDLEFLDVTINYTPPPKIELDLTATTDEKQRRVLIKRWRDDFPYFSTAQESLPAAGAGRDARIRIAGKVTDLNGPVANQTVYLRVVDPPDLAPYVPVAARRRGDNANGAGSLDATTLSTDGTGRFETVLNTTRFASGDNYQIEASTVPNFGNKTDCEATNNCYSGGVITAWKRVHLEVGRMFQRGSFISSSAPTGTQSMEVLDVSPFKPGARVVLLHGPLTRVGPSQPASEYATFETTIEAGGVIPFKNSPGGTLTLVDAVPLDLLGLDGRVDYPSTVTDFIAVVTGDPNKDYYELNVTYLKSLFEDAFVDYILTDPVSLPLVEMLIENDLVVNEETHPFAHRWFRHFGYANHQFIFGSRASTSAIQTATSGGARGITRAFDGFSYSHVMVPKILGLFQSTNSRRLLGEATAHEVAHQWHTNRWSSHTGNGEHCGSFRYYDDPSKYCLMHYTYDQSAGTTLPEFYDDVVRFHYVSSPSGADSEYRWIRERCEPVPVSLFATSVDWWATLASPCR